MRTGLEESYETAGAAAVGSTSSSALEYYGVDVRVLNITIDNKIYVKNFPIFSLAPQISSKDFHILCADILGLLIVRTTSSSI